MPFFTVAIEVFDDFQLTPDVDEVKYTDLSKLKFEMFVLDIFTFEPLLTLSLQLAEYLPEEAVMVAEPDDFALTIPFESTEATELSELDHFTESEHLAVMASLLPT